MRHLCTLVSSLSLRSERQKEIRVILAGGNTPGGSNVGNSPDKIAAEGLKILLPEPKIGRLRRRGESGKKQLVPGACIQNKLVRTMLLTADGRMG